MGYVERKLEQIAWDSKGRKVQGRLMAIDKVQYRDGAALRYTLDVQSTVVLMPGATQLNHKLRKDDVGCNVYVEYLGEDETRDAATGKNRPKLFKVMVDKDSRIDVAPVDYAPPITDADIPF